jgi:hypothetical protein
MTTVAGVRNGSSAPLYPAWLPMVVLPAAVVAFAGDWPPWALMWALAIATFAGFKWLTFATSPSARRASFARGACYLVLWPGMDAEAFLEERPGDRRASPPTIGEWVAGSFKLAAGLLLVYVAAPAAATFDVVVAAWMGMIGVALVLHFGVFHLVANGWRAAGREVRPIMDAPLLATSTSDFWGRRWNRAFRDAADSRLFRPLRSRFGPAAATMAVFAVSGLVHEFVISLPAGGGYGGPMLYFLLQGLVVLAEQSRVGRRLVLRRAAAGRIVAAVAILSPLPLLFHGPFIERVVVPFLAALGAL